MSAGNHPLCQSAERTPAWGVAVRRRNMSTCRGKMAQHFEPADPPHRGVHVNSHRLLISSCRARLDRDRMAIDRNPRARSSANQAEFLDKSFNGSRVSSPRSSEASILNR